MITGPGNGASQNPAYRPSPAVFDPGGRMDETLKRVKQEVYYILISSKKAVEG
jgi:hypothetical protein